MELSTTLQARRSIRKFKPDPVPDQHITALLEAARLAPSGSNLQPCRYVVVKSEEARNSLAPYTLPFVIKAPVIIVCCVDAQVWGTAPERWDELNKAGAFSRQDIPDILAYKKNNPLDESTAKAYSWLNAAIAIDHMTLKAVDLGLGTCWIGIVDREKTREVLELDPRYQIVALLPVGYPDQAPPPRPRLPLDQLLLKQL